MLKKMFRAIIKKISDNIANSLKDTLIFNDRTSPATKLAMLTLHDHWRTLALIGQPLPKRLGGGGREFSVS